jgi:hypothetical protein
VEERKVGLGKEGERKIKRSGSSSNINRLKRCEVKRGESRIRSR